MPGVVNRSHHMLLALLVCALSKSRSCQALVSCWKPCPLHCTAAVCARQRGAWCLDICSVSCSISLLCLSRLFLLTATDATEKYEVQARGEMQLAVVIEGMRREGIELAVSPPQVLYR